MCKYIFGLFGVVIDIRMACEEQFAYSQLASQITAIEQVFEAVKYATNSILSLICCSYSYVLLYTLYRVGVTIQ